MATAIMNCPNCSEFRIYLCPRDETIFAVVSEEDYQWCIQWRWQFTQDRHKRKYYATRSTWDGNGRRRKIYLHKAILEERMNKPQPTPKHHIGDHLDGESLNCRRPNLDWATPSMNALNRKSQRRNTGGGSACAPGLGGKCVVCGTGDCER